MGSLFSPFLARFFLQPVSDAHGCLFNVAGSFFLLNMNLDSLAIHTALTTSFLEGSTFPETIGNNRSLLVSCPGSSPCRTPSFPLRPNFPLFSRVEWPYSLCSAFLSRLPRSAEFLPTQVAIAAPFPHPRDFFDRTLSSVAVLSFLPYRRRLPLLFFVFAASKFFFLERSRDFPSPRGTQDDRLRSSEQDCRIV